MCIWLSPPGSPPFPFPFHPHDPHVGESSGIASSWNVKHCSLRLQLDFLLGMISAKFLFSLSLWASLFPSVAHAPWAVQLKVFFSSFMKGSKAAVDRTGVFTAFLGGNANSHHFAFGRLYSLQASSKPSFVFLK